MEEENVYKLIYVVFDLLEEMYIKCFHLYQTNEYTNKVILAQEFRTERDAITGCKECELKCFRVDKIYVLEY